MVPQRARQTFRSFAVVDFRWFAGASLMVNVATWMQRIAQDWLAMTIAPSGQGTTVGIVTALQFLPMLLASPFAGALADRLPKRRVLVATSLALAISAIALGAMTAKAVVSVPMLYAFALVLGVAAAIDGPARMAYVRTFTPDKDLVNAIGLSALLFHTSRVLGPALAGALMAAAGTGSAFLAVGCCHLLATVMLGAITREKPASPADRPGLRAAATRLGRHPDLLVLMALACVVSAFAMNFQITITLMATRTFSLSAGAFGALTSLMALGSIGGALSMSASSGPSYRMICSAAGGLGLAYTIAALCPGSLAFAMALVPIGFLSNRYMVASSSLFQLRAPGEIQGRALGLYQTATYVLVPAGAALIGRAADIYTPRIPLGIAGLTCIAAALVASRMLARRHGQTSTTAP
ncbi:MFS transporter [Novosphingobium sp. BL-52-GroH]|uniref:MFS transporter n=1 Tax=Novosphingobium sp. BL-52-GroH TaxID=3349877 RepID=UPI00384E5601